MGFHRAFKPPLWKSRPRVLLEQAGAFSLSRGARKFQLHFLCDVPRRCEYRYSRAIYGLVSTGGLQRLGKC